MRSHPSDGYAQTVPLRQRLEGATSTWTVQDGAEGSPPTLGNWEIGPQAIDFVAGTSTADTLLLGFGLEQVATPARRQMSAFASAS